MLCRGQCGLACWRRRHGRHGVNQILDIGVGQNLGVTGANFFDMVLLAAKPIADRDMIIRTDNLYIQIIAVTAEP